MTAEKLINELVHHWSNWEEHEQYYLETLTPQLMEKSEAGDDKEREIFNALRSCLNDDEWLDLPKLICESRAKNLRKIEHDELLKKKKREEELRKLEEERLRKEKERLKVSKKKRIASFLKEVQGAAIKGIFDVGIPDELADVIDDAAYNNALHAGSRIYFQEYIQDGDLMNYDGLKFHLPNSLKQLHQEIKAKYEHDELLKKKKREEELQKLEEESLKESKKKRIASFLKEVQGAAIKGIFDVGIPDELADVIDDAAYNNALHAGSRIYFQEYIQDGDLMNYDGLKFHLPNSLKQLHQEIKAKYVSQAIEISTKIRLDNEQLNAVLADEKVIKVTARAGSGKTRVLVAKAFYLIKFYKVSPNSILLLAFNRNAAREIQDRLKSLLEIDTFHTARTFHSLACQISKPESELVLADADPAMDQVGEIIEEILRGLWNGDTAESIYTFFRNEAREYEELGLHLEGKKFYNFRRSLPQSTLRGDTVKSNGEKIIADYLFEHEIIYKYEPTFRMPSEGIYRPDFRIWVGEGEAKRSFIWEHWAFDPNYSAPNSIDGWSNQDIQQYRQDVTRKRKYWADEGYDLIETHSGMLSGGRDCFESSIQKILLGYKIEHTKLSEVELLKRVKVNLRSRLSKLLYQFVNRALSFGNDIEKFLTQIYKYTTHDHREQFFLKLGTKVLNSYLIHLEENKKIDFSLFFAHAIKILNEASAIPLIHASGGNMIDLNELRYIFVDEAQDMSPNYLLLLQSLNTLLPNAKMMFVGDDWQAINRFAGANVNLFIELNKHYGKTAVYALKSNYRSRENIVKTGNLLMSGNTIEHSKAMNLRAAKIQSIEINKIWLELRNDDVYESERLSDKKFFWGNSPTEAWKNDPGNDKAQLVKAIYSICRSVIGGTDKIAVLFRTNKFKGSYIDDIRDKVLRCFDVADFSQNQIQSLTSRLEFSTAHRSKGKEYDTVLIVYPHYGAFPMIHSDISLFRFFGDSLEQALEDEKRLFYVAITRAERRLIFLMEGSKNSESPFMSEFEDLVDNLKLSELLIT